MKESVSNLKKFPGHRGLFIVFEGIDRIGKTTQVELLKEYLNNEYNIPSEIQTFPDRNSESGKILNSLLQGKTKLNLNSSHLLFSFNRWEKQEEIEKLLKKGVNLLVDRYAFSGVIYSMVQGYPLDRALFADRGLIRPDLVFRMTANVDYIRNRHNFGKELYEKDYILEKVNNYYNLFNKKIYWNNLNAERDIQSIFKDVVKIVKQKINFYSNPSYSIFEKKNKILYNSFPYDIGKDLFTNKKI